MTELHQLCDYGLGDREPFEGCIQGQELVCIDCGGQRDRFHFDALQLAAMFEALLMPSRFHQDSPHGLGGSRKEMTATVPGRLILVLHQAEIRLVYERGRLQRLPRLLEREFCRGQLT